MSLSTTQHKNIRSMRFRSELKDLSPLREQIRLSAFLHMASVLVGDLGVAWSSSVSTSAPLMQPGEAEVHHLLHLPVQLQVVLALPLH